LARLARMDQIQTLLQVKLKTGSLSSAVTSSQSLCWTCHNNPSFIPDLLYHQSFYNCARILHPGLVMFLNHEAVLLLDYTRPTYRVLFTKSSLTNLFQWCLPSLTSQFPFYLDRLPMHFEGSHVFESYPWCPSLIHIA